MELQDENDFLEELLSLRSDTWEAAFSTGICEFFSGEEGSCCFYPYFDNAEEVVPLNSGGGSVDILPNPVISNMPSSDPAAAALINCSIPAAQYPRPCSHHIPPPASSSAFGCAEGMMTSAATVPDDHDQILQMSSATTTPTCYTTTAADYCKSSRDDEELGRQIIYGPDHRHRSAEGNINHLILDVDRGQKLQAQSMICNKLDQELLLPQAQYSSSSTAFLRGGSSTTTHSSPCSSSSGSQVEMMIRKLQGGASSSSEKIMKKKKKKEAGAGEEDGGRPWSCKNLMAERRRRKRLNDRLSMLRSVVPKISKMDRTSILGDTIGYMKELLYRIKALQEEIQADGKPVAAGDTTGLLLSTTTIFKHDLNPTDVLVISNNPKFDVERREADTRVDICCATVKPADLLLSTVSTLEALGLEIQQCVVSCFNDFGMHASCSEVTEEQRDLIISSEEIKRALFRNAGWCMQL